MFSLMTQKVLEAKRNLILLSRTRKIQDVDLIHPTWRALADAYKDADRNGYDPHLRAILSLVNAALTHNKVAFAITRKNWQELVREDQNYQTKQGEAFGSNYYKSILALAVDSDMVEVIFVGRGRAPMGLILSYEPIVKYMTVNREEQVEELRSFLNKSESIGTADLDVEDELDEIDKTEIVKKKSGKEKLTFKQVLLASFPKDAGIRFEMLNEILDTAIANECDLSGAERDLVDHYFGDRKKVTPKMKTFKKSLEDQFLGMIETYEAGKLDVAKPVAKEPTDPLDDHTRVRSSELVQRYLKRKANHSES
jgi:hypothetical protein